MGRLRTEEVRRLLRYLSERVGNPEQLAEIEDALRDQDAPKSSCVSLTCLPISRNRL